MTTKAASRTGATDQVHLVTSERQVQVVAMQMALVAFQHDMYTISDHLERGEKKRLGEKSVVWR